MSNNENLQYKDGQWIPAEEEKYYSYWKERTVAVIIVLTLISIILYTCNH